MELKTHHKHYLIAAAHGSFLGIALGAVIGTVMYFAPLLTPHAFADTCMVEPSGLTNWWTGNNDVLDYKGSNDGVLQNGAGYAAGKVGQAFNLDGTDDYVNLGSRTMSSTVSIAAWVYPTSFGSGGNNFILGSSDAAGTNLTGFTINSSGTQLLWDVYNSSGAQRRSWIATNTFTPNQWYHVAMTQTGGPGATPKLYVNGVEKSVSSLISTGAVPTYSNLPTSIGRAGAYPTQYYFAGRIDELQQYDRELTGTEITQLFTAGDQGICRADSDNDGVANAKDYCAGTPPATPVNASGCPTSGTIPAPANLRHFYDGDAISGVTATDRIPSGTATLTNGATTATGKVGNAFSLDGVNDYVAIPHDSTFDFGTGDFALGAWVNTSVTSNSSGGGSFSTIQPIVTKRNPASLGNPGYTLFLNNGLLSFWMSDGTTLQANTSINLADGQWHHVFVSVNRTSTAGGIIYVDGTAQFQFDPTPRSGSVAVAVETRIGGDNFSGFQVFQGKIDEVQWFNRAINAKEVLAMFTADSQGLNAAAPTCGDGSINQASEECDDGNTSGGDGCSATCAVDLCVNPLSGLRAWFKLDETSGTTLVDQTGLHNGTLGGTSSAGKVGTSRDFTPSFAQSPASTDFSLDSTKDFTIETWMMRTGPASGTDHILGVRAVCSAAPWNYQMTIDPSTGVSFGSNVGGVSSGAAYYPAQNVWTHVAVTGDNGFYKLYVNGVLTASGSASFVSQSAPLVLGSASTSGTCGTMRGKLDEVKVYNRTLTQSEISSEFNSQSAGTCALACGDGVVSGSEQCDDGNTTDGDNCSATCSVEVCVDTATNRAHTYHAENNANDSSGTANASLAGNTTYAAGKVGQAFSFDGSRDWVAIPSGADIIGTGPFSLSAWIKTTDTDGAIFNQRSTVGFVGAYVFSVEGGFLRYWSYNGSLNHNVISQHMVNDGQWHFVTMTRASDATVRLYIDGVLDNSGTGTNTSLAALGVYIGGSQRDPAGPDMFGLIDDPTIWTKQLSQAEVESLYKGTVAGICAANTCGDNVQLSSEECDDGNTTPGDGCSATCTVDACTNMPSGVVAEYKASSNANDTFGVNNGSLQAGVTASATGKVGNGFTFTGAANQRVQIPDSPSLTTANAISVEAWVNPSSGGAARAIVSKYNSNASAFSWVLSTNASNGIDFNVYDEADNARGFSTNSDTIVPNFWTHVIGTYDVATNTGHIYINGQDVAVTPSGSGSLPQIQDSTAPVYIGSVTNISGAITQIWQGLIDEVRIYNRPIDDSEALRLYASQSAGVCAVTCGDSTITGNETCDDGNTANGDGCSSVCLAETCAQTPYTGMLAWWKFENNLNDTRSTHNGTGAGTIAYVTGKVGQALSLSGVGNYVNLDAHQATVNTAAPVTVAGWVNLTGDTCRTLLTARNGLAFPANTEIDINLGNGCTGNLTNEIISLARVVSGTFNYSLGYTTATRSELIGSGWHHVAVTTSGAAGGVKIYLDGVAKTVTVGSGSNTGLFGGLTGITQASIGLSGNDFSGSIDELQMFNRELSASEILDIVNAGAGGICQVTCGNTVLDGGEQCDDGNTTPGDGCSSTCTNEAVSCIAEPNTLFDWYTADDITGATINDSKDRNDGTNVNSVPVVAGKVGNAFSFTIPSPLASGTARYISIPQTVNMDGSGFPAVTMQAWVKPTATSGGQAILSSYDSTISTPEVTLMLNAGKVRFLSQWGLNYPSNALDVNSIATLPAGQWSHVAAVWSGGNNVALYINGQPATFTYAAQNAGSRTALAETSLPFRIGAMKAAGSTRSDKLQNFFNGLIDEVQYSNTAWTAGQIQANYNAQSFGICTYVCGNGTVEFPETCDDSNTTNNDGCNNVCQLEICADNYTSKVLYLKGENNGTDSSPSHYDAQVLNGVTYAAGKQGQSFVLDGVNDVVRIPSQTNINFGDTAFSGSFWFKTTSTASNDYLMGKHFGGSTNGFFIGLNPTTSAGYAATSPGGLGLYFGGAFYPVTASNLNNGQWHQVGLSFEPTANVLKLYIDGSVANTITTGNGVVSAGALEFGGLTQNSVVPACTSATPCSPFPVSYDEIQFFNTTLTDNNMIQLFNDGVDNLCTTAATCGNTFQEYGEGCDDGNTSDGDGCSATCTAEICSDSTTSKVFHFTLDETATSGTVTDSAHGITGSYTGITSVPGHNGTAMQTVASNTSGINLGDRAAYTTTTQVTLSAWVKSSTLPGANTFIINKDQCSVNIPPYGLYFATNSRPSFFVMNNVNGPVNPGVVVQATASTTLSLGEWHHLVGTYNGSASKLYVDGVEVASTNGTISMFDSSGALTIGSRIGCSSEFMGQPVGTAIDDVEMYNVSLSANQVASIYNSDQGGLCSSAATCGNSITETGESCDDGNTADGDNCSATCQLEVCSDFNANLAAIYHAESNGNDSSGNNNTVTLNNGATYATGKVGNAFSFDGTDDSASAAHNATLAFPDSFSFGMWVNPTNLTNSPLILSKEVATGNRFGLQATANGALCFYINSGSCLLTTSPGVITTNTWTHVAVVLNNTGNTAGIYVNGQLATFGATTADATTNTASLFIGKSNLLAGFNFAGLIDEVQIFNRNLTAAEVSQLYNADQFGQCTASVCGNGTMDLGEACDDSNTTDGDGCSAICQVEPDTCTDATAADLLHKWRGENNTNDVKNTANGTVGVGTIAYAAGKVGQALSFNGSTRINIGTPGSSPAALIGNVSYSFSGWIKTSTNGGWVMSQRSSSGFTGQYAIAIDGSGKLGYFTYGNGNGDPAFYGHNFSSNATVADGQWHHIAITKSTANTNVLMYIDGVLDKTVSGTNVSFNDRGVYIGANQRDNNGFFTGQIDELAIWDRQLTAGEVAGLYAAGNTGDVCPVDAVCGNNLVEGAETCDDGNTAAGDNCSATCQVEICADTNANAVGIFHAENNLTDSSGQNNVGTLFNGATYGTGKAGQGFLLDGADDVVTLGNSSDFNVGDTNWTANVWFQADPDKHNQTIFAKHVAGTTNGFFLVYNSSTDGGAFPTSNLGGLGGYVGSTFFASTRTDLNDGGWHSASLSFNGATNVYKLYIDGVLDKTATMGNGVVSAAPISLGGLVQGGGNSTSTPGFTLQGTVDEFSFFNTVLTDAQVASLYFYVDTGLCSNSTPDPVVGDGVVNGGEQCDDGNTANGDGCDSNGQFENVGFCPTPGTYSGDRVIDHNCTLVPGTYVFNNNLIIGGAGTMTLTMQSNPAASGYKGVDLQVLGNLTVNSDAAMTADGQGTVAQLFPALNPCGTSVSSDYESTAEAGFGGVNCGNPVEPTSLGGAGDKGTNTTAGYSKGGGAVKITVDGIYTQNGTLTSNGLGNRTKLFDFTPNGGGAGGSIWITAATLAGSGPIRANGGPNAQMSTYTNIGRGGHGGHIFIDAATSTYTGQLKAEGSALGMNMGTGDNGSIIFNNQSYNSGTSMSLTSTGCPLPGNYTGDMAIDKSCRLLAGTYAVDGNVTIGGLLPITVTAENLPQYSDPTYAGVHFVVSGDMTILSNATLSSDAQGYGSKMGGLGNGIDNHNGAGGAGYCGLGGHGTQAGGGVLYGDADFPLDPGSEGGDNAWSRGGKGGGALWLTVNNELAINGTISANGAGGNAGLGGAAGGGSGGALNLNAQIISGNGLVRANGGNGNGVVQNQGGGGSAGRIHLGATTNNFTGTKQTNGGGASLPVGAQVGSNCTVSETTFVQTCGDGVINAGEVCDDTNNTSTDACNSTCTGVNYTVNGNAAIANAQRDTTNNYVGYTVHSTAASSFQATLTATTNRVFLSNTSLFKDTDTNCSNGGLTAVTGPETIAPGDTHFCIKYDVGANVNKQPQPSITLTLDLVTGRASAAVSQGVIEIDVFPKRDTLDGMTTNFDGLTNLRAALNPTIEKLGFSKAVWNGIINVSYEDFDTHMRLGSNYIIFDSTTADSTLVNTPAKVTFENITCDNFALYHASGFRAGAQDLVDNGRLVATQGNIGTDCIDGTLCKNVMCSGSTLTFDAQHFDGFAVGVPTAGSPGASTSSTTGSSGGASGTSGGGGGGSSGGGAGGTTGSTGSGGGASGSGGGTGGGGGSGGNGGGFITTLTPLWGNIAGAPGYLWGNIIGGIGGGTGGGAGGGTGGGAGGGSGGGGSGGGASGGGSIGGGAGGASGGGAGASSGGGAGGGGAGGASGGGAGGGAGGGSGGSGGIGGIGGFLGSGGTGGGAGSGSSSGVLYPIISWGGLPGLAGGGTGSGVSGGTGGGFGGGTASGVGGGTAGGGGASTGGAGSGGSASAAGGGTGGGGGASTGGVVASTTGGAGTGGGSSAASGGTGGTTAATTGGIFGNLTSGSASAGGTTTGILGSIISQVPTTGGSTGYTPPIILSTTGQSGSTTGTTTASTGGTGGTTGTPTGFVYGPGTTTGTLTTGTIISSVVTEVTGGSTGVIPVGNSNINGTVPGSTTGTVTGTSGGSDTHGSAPGTGSGSGVSEGGVCTPPQLRDFVSSDTLQGIATLCQDPIVLQQIVGISPQVTYNQKFEEYTFRGLLETTLAPVLNTIGMRDSDNDGLSDGQELVYNTDPFYWDTDHDSYTDGEEVLTYNTDPLDPKSRTDGRSILITNIKDGMVTTDSRPVIAGIATPAAQVEVREGSGSGTLLLGKTRADAKGKFLLVPETDLADGDHYVKASEITDTGNVIITSPTRWFTVKSLLGITPPEITRIETKADCHTYVYGKSQVGTAVVGYFQSLLTVSSIVADSASGEFVVKSSTCLEPGQHTATLYATIPTGERSASVQAHFEVKLPGQGSPWDLLPWITGLLVLMILFFGTRKHEDMVLYMETKEGWAKLKNDYDRHLEEAQARMAALTKDNKPMTAAQAQEQMVLASMTYRPSVPVTRKDLSMRAIGFTTQEWHTDEDGTRRLNAQVELTGKIVAFELWTPGQHEPMTLLPGQVMPHKLRNMRVTYRFAPDPLPEHKAHIAPFNGARYDDQRLYRETEDQKKKKQK